MIKKWIKKDNNSIMEACLKNLGVSSTDEINNWYRISLSGGYFINLLTEAAELAWTFREKKVKIVGDYDMDGQASTSILLKGLKYIGFKNVSYRIPKRFSEGFGINMNIVNETDEDLVIIVDNGIAQKNEVAALKKKGTKVIVLDHHEATGELSEPDFLIDPEALKESAKFAGYCGSGLAYKFVLALLDIAIKTGADLEANNTLSVEDFKKSITVLAMLGTVGDVMDLREENYVIVRRALDWVGMANLNPGLYTVLALNDMTSYVTATNIGFKIVPMFNACSRMEDDGAVKAIELLISEKPYLELKPQALEIANINAKRKELTEEYAKRAEEIINQQKMQNDYPLVLNLPDAPLGIIGIIASKVMEKYKKPVFLVTEHEEEVLLQNGRKMKIKKLKGSGRGPSGYKINEALISASEYLIPNEFGGHEEGAAGLALTPENFDGLRKALILNGKENKSEASEKSYDFQISASEVKKTLEEISKFEPFGKGNPTPIFKITGFEAKDLGGYYKKIIGGGSVQFTSTKGFKATGFGLAEDMAGRDSKDLELIGTLSYNYWKGVKYPQVMFEDFTLSDSLDSSNKEIKFIRKEGFEWDIS